MSKPIQIPVEIILNDFDNRVADICFCPVTPPMRKNLNGEIILPRRGTAGAMAYDFFSPIDITIPAFGKALIWTDIKAYMSSWVGLVINVRSSMGIKGIRLANTAGWIDSDYADNPDNDGNIGICLENTTETPYKIAVGDRIAQGMFVLYLITVNDKNTQKRQGGFGSTGE